MLSCSDHETTLRSLEEITGVSSSQITQFIKSTDKSSFQGSGERVLWRSFVSEFSVQPPAFCTSYFHGCRRFSHPNGSEDLLPNNLAIDHMWENIWFNCSDLLPLKSLTDFKTALRFSDQYGQYFQRINGDRVRDRGPWGFIVKDCLKRNGTDHYLCRWPEIVSIIINFSEQTFGVDISVRLKRRTAPYIIQFRTGDSDPVNLGYALLYLHEAYDDTPLFPDYKCYSAHGQKISIDCILSIEKAG